MRIIELASSLHFCLVSSKMMKIMLNIVIRERLDIMCDENTFKERKITVIVLPIPSIEPNHHQHLGLNNCDVINHLTQAVLTSLTIFGTILKQIKRFCDKTNMLTMHPFFPWWPKKISSRPSFVEEEAEDACGYEIDTRFPIESVSTRGESRPPIFSAECVFQCRIRYFIDYLGLSAIVDRKYKIHVRYLGRKH